MLQRRRSHLIADPVGIFPNEGAIVRPIGAVLLEATDEWGGELKIFAYLQTSRMSACAVSASCCR